MSDVVDLALRYDFLCDDYKTVKKQRDDLIVGLIGKIRLSDLVGYVHHQAGQWCEEDLETSPREVQPCATERSWMCSTCWARDIVKGQP